MLINRPEGDPLGCAPCTWSASFLKHVSSPKSSQPSLLPRVSTACSCCSFSSVSELGYWGFLMGDALGILGVFTSFTAGWVPGRGTTAAPAATTCMHAQRSTWSELTEYSCMEYLSPQAQIPWAFECVLIGSSCIKCIP